METSGGEVGPYTRWIPVTFGECDPAAIAYYPRFFDWFHRAMEGWYEAVTGRRYADLILVDKRGLPAVHTEADFVAPCRLGEEVGVVVRVARVGTSSMDLRFTVIGRDGSVRARGGTVVVHVDLDPTSGRHMQPLPLIDERFAAYAREFPPQ